MVSQGLKRDLTYKLVLFLMVIGGAALFVSGLARTTTGQAKPDKLQYGVVYSCPEMDGYEFKIISCDDQSWCQVFIVNHAAPKGGNVTGEGKGTLLSLIKKGACTVAGQPEAEDQKPDHRNGGRDVEDRERPKPDAADNPANDGAGCPSDPALKSVAKATDSIELKSKRAILAHFQMAVDKGEKVAVGITFEGFQIGPPRINRRGDTLYFEDAPVGAKIYPAKSKFTLCSLFSTEITRDITDGRFECFKDNFGEWQCATATGYRIISTTYEKIKKH